MLHLPVFVLMVVVQNADLRTLMLNIRSRPMYDAGVVSVFVFQYEVIVLQATIGIDFLSKTMYLEDRTVSPARH